MDSCQRTTVDSWLDTEWGHLFVRCWEPLNYKGNSIEKSPIILFHESLGCVQLWRTFPSVLAETTGRQVIAYDRLGFGQSAQRTDNLSFSFIKEEAEKYFPVLCEQLQINRFIALGHSVGGGMATCCAAMNASLCDGLITESAQSFVEDKTITGIQDTKELFKQPDMFKRLERYHGEKTRWVMDAFFETWLSPSFSNWSLEKILPQVKCPTLVIHGGNDEYGSNRHPEMISRLVDGPAQMEIVPDIGHVPHRECEQWVAMRVAGFVEMNC